MENTLNLSTIRNTASSVMKSLEGMARTLPSIPQMINRQIDADCPCPPKHECPPHCILAIRRTAYAGERIIVPFRVKNTHNVPHTYQIGHWPLMDEDGTVAPSQPVLNRNAVSLAPNQSVVVLMTVDLAAFKTGHTYNMEIVLRESKFNQNICFTLKVADFSDAPVAKPWDENSVYPKFLDWQTHFTCPSK